LPEDIPGLAVKAYLVTYEYALGSTVSRLRLFARSMCQNFEILQTSGHPKWREVDLTLPELGRGWAYYPPMARELQNCGAGKRAAAPLKTCSQQERILGLCK
jgi:hypothetical protein